MMSLSLVGLWDFNSGTEGLMGIDKGLRSLKLNRVIIDSIYECCDNDIIFSGRFQVILIPKSQWAGPRSVILYFSFILILNLLMDNVELPVTMQLSTWMAKIMILFPSSL